ncbi:MAG: DUF4402 domain-containing protein, partial [Bacteroidales bacterium]|nr:DUF4402 domain-containing protein [Bacteroidales bacterium]
YSIRRYLFSLFSLVVISTGVIVAQTASPASVTGHITAQVITTLAAVETSQMNFGRFSPGPQGGELILTPENNISVMGSVWPGSGTHNAASFYVTGDPGVAYTITLPVEPVTITHMGTARTMTVEDWISVPAPTPGAGMLADGSQTVYVGATLMVGTLNDNPVGIYTGTYTITFDFN